VTEVLDPHCGITGRSALAGDLAGFWSIRVNDQWRIIFKFEGGNASEVRFLDYH